MSRHGPHARPDYAEAIVYLSEALRSKGDLDSAIFLGHNYPKDALGTAPAWGQNRENSYLDFDGKGNYIVFPKETVPHSAFTITFDFKPLSGKRPVLLFSYGKSYGPYAWFMENCGLHWRFMNQKDEKFEIKTDTGITVGSWNTVKIVYDLSSIMLLFNNKWAGECRARVSIKRCNPIVFGGHGSEGCLFQRVSEVVSDISQCGIDH